MPHLTPDQRTKRINAALDRKYPLISSHFYTTPDREVKKLQRFDEAEKKRHERFEALDREFYERAAWSLYLLYEQLGEEELDRLVAERDTFLESQWGQSLKQPCYISDYWYNQVRKYYYIPIG